MALALKEWGPFFVAESANIDMPGEHIETKILYIRGKKVIMDRDLAGLYGVETRVLNQAVRRNIKRFPEDFMFQLNEGEMKIWEEKIGFLKPEKLISQFVISKKHAGGWTKRPLVFTEQGIAMLSSVLKSEQAIQVNIQIMRTFTKLREMLATNKELRDKIEKLEKKYDNRFKVIFDVIKKLLSQQEEPKRQIGFTLSDTSHTPQGSP